MAMVKTDTLAVESAKVAIAEALCDSCAENAELIACKCRALIVGYDVRWSSMDWIPQSIEQTWVADLLNPETQRNSRTFRIGGKIDLIYQRAGKLGLVDHKTTSQDIADPESPFWRVLAIEGQASHYHLLTWQNGIKLDEAVWDVMRKPQISPKKLSKAERTAIVANREYCDYLVSQASLDSLQTDERETLELYEARLTRDCTVERPEHYFQRRPVPRLDSELIEYAKELWEHGQEILHARNTNRHARNSGACLLYGTPCKFLGICSGHDTPDSDKWARKANVHSELRELEGDGRDVVTNSRIRCFQTCRRKHYYQYEMGIERYDEEEREVLLFGHVWHHALAAWWSAFLPKESEDGYSHTQPAVIAVAGHGAADEADVAF